MKGETLKTRTEGRSATRRQAKEDSGKNMRVPHLPNHYMF